MKETDVIFHITTIEKRVANHVAGKNKKIIGYKIINNSIAKLFSKRNNNKSKQCMSKWNNSDIY